jgi:alpha-galactosidase
MKISIVGGGSYCWTPTLFRDIILTPGLEGAEIVLEDINRRHLDDLHRCCVAILRQFGKTREFRLSATMNLPQALRGADYVILTITTGGLAAMAHDIEIPNRYGIYQPVGDTVGPGGIARALRNIPVVVRIAKQMERYCPNAWLLNITNPMSVLTRCVGRETDVRCVGLCHELYGTLARVERMLGATDWRKDFDCVSVGVNHLPWVISLKYKGRDAFPLLRQALADGKVPGTNKPLHTVLDHTFHGAGRVKFDLFKVFGALPAAGDRHLVEFFPYFCTGKTRRGAALGVKLTTIAQRRAMAAAWRKQVARITAGKERLEAVVSQESTSRVIAALAGLIEWKDVVNIPNLGQVPELPRDVVVETMGLVTRDHVYGLPVGRVPPAILTQIERHVRNQEQTVEAALTGDRQLALQVFLNDPLCGAIGDFRKMETMMNELLAANRQWLPQFFGRRAAARP